jgi:hypothetical protein
MQWRYSRNYKVYHTQLFTLKKLHHGEFRYEGGKLDANPKIGSKQEEKLKIYFMTEGPYLRGKVLTRTNIPLHQIPVTMLANSFILSQRLFA